MSLKEGGSSRQALTEQREELREAALAEALRRHHDQAARPVRAYPQLDKLSTAWKLALPGPTNGLSSPVFREIMAQHLCLPSPACASIQGQRAGAHGGIVGPFGDELMTAHLPQDSWRTRHDLLKLELVKIANDARVPVEVEVFGLFRDIIPAEEFEDEASSSEHVCNRNTVIKKLRAYAASRKEIDYIKSISGAFRGNHCCFP